jgi:hypothetical protein
MMGIASLDPSTARRLVHLEKGRIEEDAGAAVTAND